MSAPAVPWVRRRGAWLLGGTAALATGVLIYRALNAVADEAAGAAHKRGYVARLRAALKQYSEAFLAGAEVSAGIMRDLQAFLAGDVEELPVSLRQLSRLAQSQARPGANLKEVQRSASLMVAAAVRGVLQGAQSAGAAGRARTATGSECTGDSGSDASGDELTDGVSSAASAVQDLSASLVSAAAGGGEQAHAPRQRGRRRARRRGAGEPAGGVLEQVLAALTSERGSSLVTLAIGVACRSSAEALAAAQQRSEAAAVAAGRPDLPERLMRFAGTPEGRRFATACVATFVREGTCTYLDRFEGMNMWDDLLGAMAKPAHTAAVDRMTRTFVREMVSSYLSPPRPSPARGPAQQQRRGADATACSAEPPAAINLSAFAPAAGGPPGDASATLKLGLHKGPEEGSGELATQRADFAEWADESGSEAGRAGCALGWASDIAKAPEARAMLAALAASATAEGVRAAMFGVRDLVFAPAPAPASAAGGPQAGGAAAAWQQAHPLARGYILGSLMLMLVLYLTARHGAGQLAAPVAVGL